MARHSGLCNGIGPGTVVWVMPFIFSKIGTGWNSQKYFADSLRTFVFIP